MKLYQKTHLEYKPIPPDTPLHGSCGGGGGYSTIFPVSLDGFPTPYIVSARLIYNVEIKKEHLTSETEYAIHTMCK